MSEIDDCVDAENYMDQDDFSDNESESIDPKQLDKRAHHNALERKRRDHIKDSFSSLRDAIPLLHGEKINSHKASRAQILKKAAEYIDHMRRKNTDHQKDIDVLKRENRLLEEKIRALEELKCTGQLKNSNNNDNNSKPQAPNRTRSTNKNLIANGNNSNGSSTISSISTNSSSNLNVNNLITNHNQDGTSLLQTNRVKSESISFEDDSENLLDNTETVVQIVKKSNVVPTNNLNGKLNSNGTTLLVNGTIIRQSIPQQTSSLLLGPPNKRKRLIIAANTSIISK